MKIPLGGRCRDTFTGFEGTAVGHTVWLYGCARVGIEAIELRDGKPIEVQWFDEQRIEMVAESRLANSTLDARVARVAPPVPPPERSTIVSVEDAAGVAAPRQSWLRRLFPVIGRGTWQPLGEERRASSGGPQADPPGGSSRP